MYRLGNIPFRHSKFPRNSCPTSPKFNVGFQRFAGRGLLCKIQKIWDIFPNHGMDNATCLELPATLNNNFTTLMSNSLLGTCLLQTIWRILLNSTLFQGPQVWEIHKDSIFYSKQLRREQICLHSKISTYLIRWPSIQWPAIPVSHRIHVWYIYLHLP